MSNVRGKGQSPQSGYHTDTQIKRTSRPAIARDDLREAFAGDENDGPFGDSKKSNLHSTHVKSRKTEKSKERTPVR